MEVVISKLLQDGEAENKKEETPVWFICRGNPASLFLPFLDLGIELSLHLLAGSSMEQTE